MFLYIESFKSVLRLKAQQMPESVMARLNNSEQFLRRPWRKRMSCWSELEDRRMHFFQDWREG